MHDSHQDGPVGGTAQPCGSLEESHASLRHQEEALMLRRAPAAVPVDYPSSDGQPMAENDTQRHAIIYAISALTRHFRRRPDVYVSGDLLIYYDEGNPRVSIVPDVFVVFGVEDRERPN